MNLKWIFLALISLSLTGCASSPSKTDKENYEEISNLIEIRQSGLITKYFTDNSFVHNGETVINLPKTCFPEPLNLKQLQQKIQESNESMKNCFPANNIDSDCFKNMECKFLANDQIKRLKSQMAKFQESSKTNDMTGSHQIVTLDETQKAKLKEEQMVLLKKFKSNGCSLIGNYNNLQSIDSQSYLLRFPCFGRNAQNGQCTSFDQSSNSFENYGVAYAIFKTNQKPFLGGVIYFKRTSQVKEMVFKDGTKNPVFYFNEDKGCRDTYIDVMDIQRKLKN